MTAANPAQHGPRRVADLAASAGAESEVYDAAAEELLELDGVVEVHVQRLDATSRGLAVAYAPGAVRRISPAGAALGPDARRALKEGSATAASATLALAAIDGLPMACGGLLLRVGPPEAPRALLTLLLGADAAEDPQLAEQAATLASVTAAALAATDARGGAGAGVDTLTGCLDETAMAARLDEEIQRSRRQGVPLSCLLLALDDLEAIALRYGRALGEHVLGHVGAALRREFRRFDRVAYLGRGEFAILLAGAGTAQAEVVARRVLERVHAIKLEAEQGRRSLRASAGLGEWHQPQGAWELVSSARAALLRAGPREADAEGTGPAENSADALATPPPHSAATEPSG